MNKEIQKQIDRVNQRLKADNSPVRYTAVLQYTNSYRFNRCNVQYTEKGKERLVNVEVVFQYLTKDEIIRIFMAMVLAIDAII